MELIPDAARNAAVGPFTGRGEKAWSSPSFITLCSSVPTAVTNATRGTCAFVRQRICRAHPRSGRDTQRRTVPLESDHRAVQEISKAVGYQEIAFFREIFERHTGASPKCMPAEVWAGHRVNDVAGGQELLKQFCLPDSMV